MSVFHLKYRPIKISELDLRDVAERLKSFLTAKDIPQSFLFSGPKGAGKTSAARILAREINCLDKVNGESCDKCDNCKEILGGKSMDIIEMDGASNRGIEDVRNLKDKAYLLPSKLKYKVFIIDEVHMLTKDAFNALLKLIEEPPKHTVFILCTTDAEKIPETVLSRLVRVDFKKGGKKELRNSLNKIIEGEGIEIEEKAIDFILERSDGSFRNLQRNFNELFLSFGKKLDLNVTRDFFMSKSGSYQEVDFEKDLAEGKLKLILEKLEKMANDGADFVGFRQRLVDFFQRKILLNFGVGEGNKSLLGLESLEKWMNLLIRAAKQEKEVEIDQLPLELAVIDFIGNDSGSLEGDLVEEEAESKDHEGEEKIVMENGDVNIERIEQQWGNVLLAVKPFNHSVEAFLRAARPVRFNGRTLVLEVFYPFHKDRLEEARNKKIVEDGFKKVLGGEICMECILGKSKKQPLVIQNDTPAETISERLVEEGKKTEDKDLYDVVKDIFG